ncbi:MAG: DegT/DnrJ/EryC1/StrS family aminotransferase [Verrucomicrobiae bacterium]|nr:DegT/DnrJ/EryC1/StrS family aminotransferase [Verrucomicrobiae bacterium]
MRKVPFYRPCVGEEEIAEVVATLRGGWLTTGPRTKQFEGEFAAYLGQRHAVAVNSCTAALHLALEAIGVQAGDGVVVPTMTFAATAEVVRYFQAHPILVDCREEDFNLDVADAERRIVAEQGKGRRVLAIIPVHYGGQIGDVAGVQDLARRHGLRIVEDAAHCCPAHFWESRKQKAESRNLKPGAGDLKPEKGEVQEEGVWRSVGWGADISCYSFYANKTITTGEGGMACTGNDAYAERMRIMSLHGISKDAWKRYTGEGSWYYEILAPGFKYNMTDIAAAIGIHQVRKADRLHRRRTDLAAAYQQRLGGIEEIILPKQLPGRIHSWHLYPIRLRLDRLSIDRGEFIRRLSERGIGSSVHWLPLHMHPYYREMYGYKPEDFPVAARLYPELVTLPLFPDMEEGDVDAVCQAVVEGIMRG